MIATALDHIPKPPCAKLLGWQLVDARRQDGWIKIVFDGKPEFCNPAGFVQGGMLSSMLDDTMGLAVFVMTEGRLFTTTISMTVNFLAPAKPGPVITGEATVTRSARPSPSSKAGTAADGTCSRPRAAASVWWRRRGRCADAACTTTSPSPLKGIHPHCESDSHEAIHASRMPRDGLFRFARNDG